MTTVLIGLLVSYLIGAIPTGYICVRLLEGKDLREHGSGNVGATNALRVLGTKWGLIVLGLDILKGFVCVTVVFALAFSEILPADALKVSYGLMAIVGHIWTVFLGFKGGKGVATSGGVFLALAPIPTLLALLVCLAFIAATGYVSVGSIAAAVVLPLSMVKYTDSKLYLMLSMVISALVVVLHKQNIRRLILGKENKLTLWTKKNK